MLTLAMIDPYCGAYGAMLVLGLFVAAPLSFIGSLVTRRWLIPSALIILAVSVLLLVPWIWLDAFVPGRRWNSFRVLLFGVGFSLASSLIAGLPGWAIAECLARFRQPTADHPVDQN